jgi:Fur family ferric uptake transcriptional regulator
MSSAALGARLRERGWRVTPQRRAVIDALEGEHVHLTADEIHRRARAARPDVSLATVYNALNEMMAMGEVAEVRYAAGPARYDPNAATAHHHLMCTRCGALVDVAAGDIAVDPLPADERRGFDVLDVHVLFRGTCASCESRGA